MMAPGGFEQSVAVANRADDVEVILQDPDDAIRERDMVVGEQYG